MQFRILGTLEVADGHGAIAFDAPKQRTLLAVLLLHANEVVSSGRLIDELWGERPPATATKVLQTYVSQLRKALGPDAILTRPPGYVLEVERDALDVVRFRRLTAEAQDLAAQGKPAEAEALFREALALWRGPPLADVVFESFARNEVEGLDEERLKAVMDRLDCELALGRHDQLVPELERLVGQYPLRERLRAQLMVALYRSGRQADALAAYQNARRTLVDELGLEPSAELQALERAILTHDAALDPPARAVRGLSSRRRRLDWRAVALTASVLIVLVAGLAFVLGGKEAAPKLLAANSVGFIDAESGRLTPKFRLGSEPSSLIVAFGDVWAGTRRDEIVTRFDAASHRTNTVHVPGQPVSLTREGQKVFVWTLENRLVPIKADPSVQLAEKPVPLGADAERAFAPIRGLAPPVRRAESAGRIMSGGGFIWVTVPPAYVLRVSLDHPARSIVVSPDNGVRPPIAYGQDGLWVTGYSDAFSIDKIGAPAANGVPVGHARDLTFGAGSLWVVSRPDMDQTLGSGLRRVDPNNREQLEKIRGVADYLVGVVWAAGSIWVASASERMVQRIDPATNEVVQEIPLGAVPVALAGDAEGVWVAVA
jgi:DNA-binding SARP family transcriptional activator